MRGMEDWEQIPQEHHLHFGIPKSQRRYLELQSTRKSEGPFPAVSFDMTLPLRTHALQEEKPSAHLTLVNSSGYKRRIKDIWLLTGCATLPCWTEDNITQWLKHVWFTSAESTTDCLSSIYTLHNSYLISTATSHHIFRSFCKSIWSFLLTFISEMGEL